MEGENVELPAEAKERIFELFKEAVNRVTEFEKLASEGEAWLCGYRQGLEFLLRPAIKRSDLVEKIIKSNETERLKLYFGEAAGCKNTYDVIQNINKLNSSHAGLLHHLTKAMVMVAELQNLAEETVALIQSTNNTSVQFCKDNDCVLDEVATSTCQEDYKASEYALMTCLINSMVKQEYNMQEEIINCLEFNESEELESYCLMWSLHPNLHDDLLTMAKKIVNPARQSDQPDKH